MLIHKMSQIAAAGNNVYVSWCERDVTSNGPVVRGSKDNGQIFEERIIISTM
jgi:hypothetical protein